MSMEDLNKLEYNFLGKSGIRVSNICLGTAAFGNITEIPTVGSEEKCHAMINRFAELGGNFIDTAYCYGSESLVGKWLKINNRSRYIIATKVGRSTDVTDVNCVGLSRRHVITACEDSLERLQTSYIDLYQAHIWDSGTPIEETLKTFNDLIRCGKIRYFGVSNFCGWQMQKVVDVCHYMGLDNCVSLQQQYNLLTRQSENEELTVCQREGVSVLTFSPLKSGFLSGTYARHCEPPPSSSAYHFEINNVSSSMFPRWKDHKDNDSYWRLIDVMKEIAGSHGKTIAQVGLRWLLQRDPVTAVITGATSIEELEENIGASRGWELTDHEMATLSEASARQGQYPYDVIRSINQNTNRGNTSEF